MQRNAETITVIFKQVTSTKQSKTANQNLIGKNKTCTIFVQRLNENPNFVRQTIQTENIE